MKIVFLTVMTVGLISGAIADSYVGDSCGCGGCSITPTRTYVVEQPVVEERVVYTTPQIFMPPHPPPGPPLMMGGPDFGPRMMNVRIWGGERSSGNYSRTRFQGNRSYSSHRESISVRHSRSGHSFRRSVSSSHRH